ncbi:fumarylacetoacetate hydrolase family protein [Burkholderia gladioli]|uniref:fumarylacetoacetate hydrolase family protein n=1 Tax=Burkholderia gladioli TaxID=28095 RepID=UPI0005EE5E57|nr:fumarylacetoacetate hydrolase family protein [Burkholderia gladioli]
MLSAVNETHPTRRSWLSSANDGRTDFPIQNLPFGRFVRPGSSARIGVAIGDQIVDIAVALRLGLFDGEARAAAEAASNDDMLSLLTVGQRAASSLRARLSEWLTEGNAFESTVASQILVAQTDVDMLLPTSVRQFSDMCVSTYHIGRRYGNDERGEPICPAVFRTVPVGYDGRASSVVVSGTPIRRPNGTWQDRLDGGELRFGPEPRQDYELEMGVWIGGAGNRLGQPMDFATAHDSVFGFCLLNDWSARGIQIWEAMLGPFLGKSVATTVSPWIVTPEALAPFRIPAFARPDGDPPVPAHLYQEDDQRLGGFDITLESYLSSASMRQQGLSDTLLCRTNFSYMYWTFAQMIVHHASNGCGIAPGDLIGSGTCSGPRLNQAACLIETFPAGPVQHPNGETQAWINDGDRVTLKARAERKGYVSIGFGEAAGELLAAPSWP